MIQNINVGATANDGTGDLLRNAFIKINSNFDEIELWFSDVLTTSSAIPISQITGLQTQLNSISNSISLLTSDVTDINIAIAAINDTLNDQNISITDLYSQLTALQTLVNTKIGEAPIDGLTYGRKNGAWVTIGNSGGATGPTGPQGIQGPTGPKGETGSTPDISGLVPYIGATGNVDLGEFTLKAKVIETQIDPGKGRFQTGVFGEYSSLIFDSIGTDAGVNQTVQILSNCEDGTSLLAQSLTDGTQQSVIYQQSHTISLKSFQGANVAGLDIGSTGSIFTNEVRVPKLEFLNLGEVAGEGELVWNDAQGTVNIGLKGGQAVIKSGVDLVVRIVNKVTPNTTLTKSSYQAVRISGAQGQRLGVALAQANNDNNSADTIGLVCENIAPNQEGFIMTVGQLEGIDTTGSLQGESWSDGDVLYLSPTNAGRITNVKPSAPDHIIIIGYVEYAHPVNGKIYVKIMNGWELDELHNVNITPGVTAGQVLKYDGTVWTNSSDASLTDLQIRRGGYLVYHDFFNTVSNGEFQFAAISGGQITAGLSAEVNDNHVGIVALRSLTTANSGYYIVHEANTTATAPYKIKTGMQFDLVFNTGTISATNTIRFGFMSGTLSSNDASNGCYFQITNNSLVGKTANATVRSQTSAFTLSNNTWYHARVFVNSTSLVTFTVFNDSGTALFTATLNTNLPAVTTVLSGNLIATNSGTTSLTIIIVDYMGVTIPGMQRGALT